MGNRLTKGIGLFGHVFTRKLRFDTNDPDDVSADGQISWSQEYGTFSGYLVRRTTGRFRCARHSDRNCRRTRRFSLQIRRTATF